MKFKSGSRRKALEYEKDWVQKWKEDGTFEKSVENRPKDNSYVFYDGPPFITGVPHHGTLLSSIVKDAVPRYWTMKGKRVERVWGWDCHGLPAENFVEKQLVITDRRQIITSVDQKAPLDKEGNELPTISLEKYVETARDSMVANSATWEGVIDRIGRWVDFKGAYRTMDKDFMESVWWAFKQLHDAGKIYEGEKVLMYDTRFATPVSKTEVTMDNDAYQTVTDPSVYVKFKLRGYNLSGENGAVSIRALSADDDERELEFLRTVPQNENGFHNPAKPEDLTDSEAFRAFLTRRLNYSQGKDLRDGHVPSTTYWVERNGEIVGVADLRHYLNDFLRDSGSGHVGLGGIKYRGEGIGTAANRLLFQELWKMGEDDIMLGAMEVNKASQRMIEKSGGVFSKAIEDLANPGSKLFVYTVKKSTDVSQASLLAWTTTPWTLPANLMLAVNPELTYCEIDVNGERLILAEEALARVLKDEKNQPLAYTVVRTFIGADLVGKAYEPLDTGSKWPSSDKIHKVYAADFVSHESGSGIVHIAPAYGEDDFELARSQGVAAFHVIDDNGYYIDTNYNGLEVWDNNKMIAKDLKEKGIVWKIDYIQHEYPFNPRSKQRIMYRAIPSWFFDVQGSKPLMLEQNENINWFPEHLKHGRFEKNIEQAPDWNLSRDRFWATAMPVWKGDKGTVKVVGSYAELKELSGVELEDYHRPWVDDITFEIDGEKFTRIDKVLDCWFESGSMPFAQMHYPFENQEKFEANYPGDFIAEYMPQVRAWFYYLHTINTTLAECGAFGDECQNRGVKNAFKNVIVEGTLAGGDGRKMSKSLGNFTDPNELMDKFSADSLRFLLLGSPLLNGEDFAMQDKDVSDVARKLTMIWNMYDFFTMYAEVDGWEFNGELKDPLDECNNPLDIWIISRLHQLVAEVEKHMDGYNIPDAMSPILPFIDDASNWYVRRSRRRFWKSEDDGDKNDAYKTLHYVLVRLAYVLAPFAPFLAEELYSKMTGDKESIHLKDWLPAGHINQLAIDKMTRVREVINEGLSLRAGAGIKVRQPLLHLVYGGEDLGKLDEFHESIIKEEVNVRTVMWASDVDNHVSIDTNITPELKREGLMREVVRFVQNARKNAGLQVDDRITLQLNTENEDLRLAIAEHQTTIEAECLATFGESVDNTTEASIDGAKLTISLTVK